MQIKLTVPDMACSSCVRSISRAVHSLDSSADIQADPDTKRVTIETKRAPVEIEQAIVAAGYTIASGS